MSKVIEIGIHKNRGDKPFNVYSVEAIKGKGLLNNRHFMDNADGIYQITLIEIENIDYYNKISKTQIPAIDFRRNIITSGIRLNELVNKEFFIGKIKVKAHDLCRPCSYLQNMLNQKNIVKEFLRTGGLRCELLSSGKIYVGDPIKC
ncbi:MAG: sulfurase [Acidimicrobiaceae bacterium]|nr:sulfurase [Acidimicrobiaceae bacterium]|tara:strand:- start:2169 stop:2609 length:441 start_codon:yes stop_codon:yes gene_type:complete